jgi:hypothetical protein
MFSVHQLFKGKKTQENLESGFPETTFRETNAPLNVMG